ncbi:hypothetical protein AM493_02595 [Flavobacterium akiainvivens]|uniref:Tyr recombinase domain-containing protein n=1 Tax=Flavobacterium akiainvivens TaxID=1202724 RepID=A0A0M8M916_9FLAO|nr:tyrosine-type recombinase/integrase [Flavobacterium akiainvivens]KOS05045.1 hypothetical protein AM493_02595 [Flavobacterium akiainvivens]SFQ52274.1 Phage integrase SAM-like domain-containing protein [Flavobacterium akiainvivens]
MSLKIVFRPVNKDSKEGYLKVRVIENRKSKFVSLGIKLHESFWLEGKQRVSNKEIRHEVINKKIEDVLKTLSAYDNDVQVLQSNNKTILEFYQDIIDTTINEGTKLKYINIQLKLRNYFNSINLHDLKFKHLDSKKVQEFYKFIIDSGNAIDTANYNMKAFKALINKAKKAGHVRYANDPFANLQLKFSEKKLKALTTDEVKRIINTRFAERRKHHYNRRFRVNELTLREVANVFLFQLFTQGLRCSDVQFLRWRNFKFENGKMYLEYTMYKTKKGMKVSLSYIALKMIELQVIRFMPQAEDEIYSLNQLDENYAEDIYKIYSKYIEQLSLSEQRNSFVFHFFNPNDFAEFKDKEIGVLNNLQYKRLTGTRAWYNKLLKDIQEQCKISINLTSHVARHTYSQLLIENDVNLQDVSHSLGHMHISTTQTYIARLPSKNIDRFNEVFSQQFTS